MPRMRPFHSAHLHILLTGIGLESINRTISAPSTRERRSACPASMANVSAKTTGRTPRIRIRERRASDLAHAQMIMLMGICVEGEFKPPQTCDAAQPRADQRHHMIPALERFIVGIGVVPLL